MLKLSVVEKSLGAKSGEEPNILEPDYCYILDGIQAISVYEDNEGLDSRVIEELSRLDSQDVGELKPTCAVVAHNDSHVRPDRVYLFIPGIGWCDTNDNGIVLSGDRSKFGYDTVLPISVILKRDGRVVTEVNFLLVYDVYEVPGSNERHLKVEAQSYTVKDLVRWERIIYSSIHDLVPTLIIKGKDITYAK